MWGLLRIYELAPVASISQRNSPYNQQCSKSKKAEIGYTPVTQPRLQNFVFEGMQKAGITEELLKTPGQACRLADRRLGDTARGNQPRSMI